MEGLLSMGLTPSSFIFELSFEASKYTYNHNCCPAVYFHETGNYFLFTNITPDFLDFYYCSLKTFLLASIDVSSSVVTVGVSTDCWWALCHALFSVCNFNHFLHFVYYL